MPEQTNLFDERQQRKGDAHVFVQEAPASPKPMPQQVRDEALRRLKEDGKADNLRARYARLLWRAWTHGVIIEIPYSDREVTVRSLTDKEAAYILGCQNTSICGRRGELTGKDDSLPEYKRCPVVQEHQTRQSYIHGTDVENTAYRIIPDLFTSPNEH